MTVPRDFATCVTVVLRILLFCGWVYYICVYLFDTLYFRFLFFTVLFMCHIMYYSLLSISAYCVISYVSNLAVKYL